MLPVEDWLETDSVQANTSRKDVVRIKQNNLMK
jgi:hypothetical protein